MRNQESDIKGKKIGTSLSREIQQVFNTYQLLKVWVPSTVMKKLKVRDKRGSLFCTKVVDGTGGRDNVDAEAVAEAVAP